MLIDIDIDIEEGSGETADNDLDYTERTPAIDPNDSGIPSSQSDFCIIDVCADKRLFDTFIEEWTTKSYYSVSVACEKKPPLPVPNGGIGGNFQKSILHKNNYLKRTFHFNNDKL